MQTGKQQELAQLRTAEENHVATAVLDQHAKEQRERGEIADLHAKHETLREYDPTLTSASCTKQEFRVADINTMLPAIASARS